ncbi:MAG: XdhC family protein [Bacteroidota bacterium]|nr:XdhC family protein [Bacteroidota bacterium]
MDFGQNRAKIYSSLLELINHGIPCSLTIVTGTYGSTPQKPGSAAIIGEAGLISGTIGGGATENKVIQCAKGNISIHQSQLFNFDLHNDISAVNASICGGGMQILLDAQPEKSICVFQEIESSNRARIPGVLITGSIATGSGTVDIERYWITSLQSAVYGTLKPEIASVVSELLSVSGSENCRQLKLEKSGDEPVQIYFFERIDPLPMLIIAGAGHIGKALSHLGKLLGFEVIVWDDRQEYANPENLPDADQILSGSIEESFSEIELDANSYLVIVTRGHNQDALVLRHFIGSAARYVGMIGSKRKIIQVRDKFLGEGWATREQWDKIYTPVGLKINSTSVQEIAVSIAAQLILVRSTPNA